MSNYEFWDKERSFAEHALEIANEQLVRVQAIGQLALFEDPTMGQLLQFPIRKPDTAA